MSHAHPARTTQPEMVAFDGYPFAVTYIVPAFFHVTLLPADTDRPDLDDLVAGQSSIIASTARQSIKIPAYYDFDSIATSPPPRDDGQARRALTKRVTFRTRHYMLRRYSPPTS